jgi:hypothetical protein
VRTLKDFQLHYGIDDPEEAKREHQCYMEALELFRRIEERALAQGEGIAESDDDPSGSIPQSSS